jgi:alpha-N-arabinofuranosidase
MYIRESWKLPTSSGAKTLHQWFANLGKRTMLLREEVPSLGNVFCCVAALLVSITTLAVPALSQTRAIAVTIDVSKTGAPISKYIYGQFLEHGGDIVNTGVWSEMLIDRKFFFPITTTAPATPRVVATVGGGNPRFRGAPTRWWAPLGGEDVVTMDTKSPYTGDQSPLVKLDGKEARGFGQGGIVVRKGKAYTGRIVLAGSPEAQVSVTLIWGKEPSERHDRHDPRSWLGLSESFPLLYGGRAP